jgi:hypothetical protein
LKRHGLLRETPDAFLAAIYDQVVASFANARSNLTKSGASAQEFLVLVKAQGLSSLAQRLHSHITEL